MPISTNWRRCGTRPRRGRETLCRPPQPAYDGRTDDTENLHIAASRHRAGVGRPAFAVRLLRSGPVRCREIEISRAGYYDIIFDGYVARAALYRDVRDRKIDAAGEREKSAAIVADFKRDSSTKEASYVRDGIFKVHWRKSGDLLRDRMVAFFRRNENLLSVKYVKNTGRITLAGATISPSNAQRLIESGLNITGQLRVITSSSMKNPG